MSYRNAEGRFKTLQNGLKEFLLCDDCERHLNNNIERPFKQYWFDRMYPQIPKQLEPNMPYWISGFNYSWFKLFHLSVFWRFHASQLPEFEGLSFGQKYGDRIRELIWNLTPLTENEYPIFGTIICGLNGEPIFRGVSGPSGQKIDHSYTYSAIYCGVEWTLIVTERPSNIVRNVLELSPTQNGIMPLIAKKPEDTRTFRGMRSMKN